MFGRPAQRPAVRPPAVAGRFYPANPGELRRLVETLLAGAAGAAPGPAPKALVVPHAGYIYSGPVAASAYARLAPLRPRLRRVVLLGPAHFVPLDGLAAPSAAAFATPLGDVPVDVEFVRRLADEGVVGIADEPHAREHSLEVQLPFLQVVLENFSIVPLVVGEASMEAVSRVFDRVWGGPETCLLVSSDLSHFLDARTAREVDRTTADAVEALCPEAIGPGQACGETPLRGLLCAAKTRHLRAETVDLRNSSDTSGTPDRVVGYGAFAFSGPEPGPA